MSILPYCIRRPAHPVPRDYHPTGGQQRKVVNGDSWKSLAKEKGITPWQLIRFNYPNLPANEHQAAPEVNWYLQEYVGCDLVTGDRKNYVFSASADPGLVWLPGAVNPGRMTSSIYHAVPILRQPKTWACWYTSLQMVVQYWRKLGRGAGLTDPSEDAETHALYNSNVGISDRERIARKLGFTVQYSSLTSEGMWDLLRKGPVIYTGAWPGQPSGHWVVIVGISLETLAINNPAVGRQTWDYQYFMSQYLLQTVQRPLIYAP